MEWRRLTADPGALSRAVRRAVAQGPVLPLDSLLERAGELIDVLACGLSIARCSLLRAGWVKRASIG